MREGFVKAFIKFTWYCKMRSCNGHKPVTSTSMIRAVAAVVSLQQTRAAHRTISQLPHGVRRRAGVLRVCLGFGGDVALARSELLLRILSCARSG
jgi:hypothetical protein